MSRDASDLDGYLVNLVEQVYGRYVDTVALDDVNEVIGSGVTAQGDVSIVDAILGQNAADLLQVKTRLSSLYGNHHKNSTFWFTLCV